MKKKLNIVDIAIILFVCAIVVFLAFKFTNSTVLNNNADNTKNVVYIAKIGEIIKSTVDAIPDSGKLYDVDGVEIGEIVSKKVRNAETNQIKADGSYVGAINPGKYDVFLEVNAEAVAEKEGYFINGKKNFGAGSNAKLKAKNIEFSAYITEIKEK